MTTSEWLRTLVPLATFFLGAVLEYWRGARERRRDVLQIRQAVLEEIRLNYKALHPVAFPRDRSAAKVSPFAGACMQERIDGLSTEVFKSYLPSLSRLPRRDFESLFAAYFATTEAARVRRGAVSGETDVPQLVRAVTDTFYTLRETLDKLSSLEGLGDDSEMGALIIDSSG